MRRPTNEPLALWLAVALLAGSLAACSGASDAQADADSESAAAVATEIPITTASAEARELFIEGRRLAESLRALDARPVLQQAVEKDPTFASAYLLLANTAPSPEEFFSNLELAVANMASVSEGER
ncbi:MAG TPA: hypothetical protein VFS53_07300, partial [Gemmatimonadota bacterium]|nr:hypothetical protein [Gemmatimonadota bacterium]